MVDFKACRYAARFAVSICSSGMAMISRVLEEVDAAGDRGGVGVVV